MLTGMLRRLRTVQWISPGRVSRRSFMRLGAVLGIFSLGGLAPWNRAGGLRRFLRPPGALQEATFLATCIRCGLCGTSCPNRCINYFGPDAGDAAGTPYILPREQGCVLCMRCTQVCPSGALRPTAADAESITGGVRMGVAVIDTNLCYSYNDRICGVCYRACPLPDLALKIGDWERPTVDPAYCVGCGLCERICYHYPQAIRVRPAHWEA